jgi:hypothetical protein
MLASSDRVVISALQFILHLWFSSQGSLKGGEGVENSESVIFEIMSQIL